MSDHDSTLTQPDGYQGLPAEIFENLPEYLAESCKAYPPGPERDVFFLGALTLFSGMLPNVEGMYWGSLYTPHFYTFISGPAGSGKGALSLSRRLARPVATHFKNKASEDRVRYEAEMAIYSKALKDFERNGTGTPPVKPRPPRNFTLFFPADISKSGLVQLLEENNKMGIIFETEGDTLSAALDQDFGGFSDVLRKGFHKESVSFFRRGGNEFRGVDEPVLAVCLGGTPDQNLRLIPSTEDGLFSRFLNYSVPPNGDFENPWDQTKNDRAAIIDRQADSFFEYFRSLEARETPLTFTLTPDQQARVVDYFKELKTELRENISTQMDSVSNRLGLIAFRVAMTLSMLRGRTECQDQDLKTTLDLIEAVKGYTVNQFDLRPPIRGAEDQGPEIEQKRQHAKALKELGWSFKRIGAELWPGLKESRSKGMAYRLVECSKTKPSERTNARTT